jgi:hypothetical protein
MLPIMVSTEVQTSIPSARATAMSFRPTLALMARSVLLVDAQTTATEVETVAVTALMLMASVLKWGV